LAQAGQGSARLPKSYGEQAGGAFGFHQIFPKFSPLKIRGVRGVIEITPVIPLTLRGKFEERILILRGHIERETPNL